MKKKGFTLIESIVALFIFLIIVFISLDFYSFTIGINKKVGKDNSDIINATIALDFISDKIRTDKIQLINSMNKNRLEIFKTSDGGILYIKNGILRFNVDSQQIVPQIDYVLVEKKSEKLYKITITTSLNNKYTCFIGEAYEK
ncbi:MULTISPECIES: PilW family protein [Caloramator]|uniref:Prepilin-type N-terminal cleavage/methylation domain-containing protein n=1 Tax=Caloramator proteoclasticus DSM 10124 TaxID=1121262 RepID=A0A1M4Y9F8_9CLOT|nr:MULTISPECIES: prepilin-type N-terminal cleavage/methylation domain-containing protein [Caloramator]SHF02401.1 prepilin-type N-terminal cleavage/methylation domain-containing protein [Caloramator proteoclasticus DSM 10124]